MQKKHLIEIAMELRKPVIIWVIIAYIGITLMEVLAHNRILHIVISHIGILCFIVVNWHLPRFIENKTWVYFILQSIILIISASFMTSGYYLVIIGLYPILIGQMLYAPYSKVKIISFIVISYIICISFIEYVNSIYISILFISLFTLMNIMVVAIIRLTLRQFSARLRTQHFLNELEMAHHQVEELTVANERQRMARDLHDTLAQGLAGLIMQLEAVDAHLSVNNTKRAHEIVHLSMNGARHTLAEARNAIDDLRAHTAQKVHFNESVEKEIEHFIESTGIPVAYKSVALPEVSQLIHEHSIQIIRESLTNIIKHAQATQVQLTIASDLYDLIIDISDNGKGFDIRQIGALSGHYGLIGMQERTRIIHGTLTITNRIPHGTSIHLKIPLRAGEHDET
ncbi:sensor histidine kinase [Paenibacillus nicotianae]|uniref:histidine kinase n=1 Tax=Paenibacillus nicotianae TaxID=1526551 RepID=A0ABW4US80_9BACL